MVRNLITCDFAINGGNLSKNKIVEEINLKLKNKEIISDNEIQTISDLMESHDEIYFDTDDDGKDTDKRMNEISYAVGYSSVSAFSNTFQKLTNLRPTEFKLL